MTVDWLPPSQKDARSWAAAQAVAQGGFFVWGNRESPALIAILRHCHRREGGIALTDYALEWPKYARVSVVMLETGGDPGHAPVRNAYEKQGMQLLPIAQYFKKI